MADKFVSIQVRVDPEEKKKIRDYFDSKSINLSDWIRKKLLEEIGKQNKPLIKVGDTVYISFINETHKVTRVCYEDYPGIITCDNGLTYMPNDLNVIKK